MPVAPESFSAGMSVLMSFLDTTRLDRVAVFAEQLRDRRRLQRRQQVDDGFEVHLVDVQLHEHSPARFERAEQQGLELFHRLALLGVGVRRGIRDQLGVRDDHGVEHLEARGSERTTTLGAVDHRVGDLRNLRLGRAVRQRDLGVDTVLLQEPGRELGVFGLHTDADGQVLRRGPLRVAGHREHDAERPRRGLGVVELRERRDLHAGLLDPVAAR